MIPPPWKLEARKSKLETRKWKFEIRNSSGHRPETVSSGLAAEFRFSIFDSRLGTVSPKPLFPRLRFRVSKAKSRKLGNRKSKIACLLPTAYCLLGIVVVAPAISATLGAQAPAPSPPSRQGSPPQKPGGPPSPQVSPPAGPVPAQLQKPATEAQQVPPASSGIGFRLENAD